MTRTFILWSGTVHCLLFSWLSSVSPIKLRDSATNSATIASFHAPFSSPFADKPTVWRNITPRNEIVVKKVLIVDKVVFLDYPEGRSSKSLRNIGNYIPVCTASWRTLTQPSATPLRKIQQRCNCLPEINGRSEAHSWLPRSVSCR
jgi:hypothetical protein